MNEDRLDQALEALNNEDSVSAEASAEARARVWEKLMASPAAVCAGFQADLTTYAEGRLSAQRRLLVEDHLARCAGCRRAFAELRGQRNVVAMPTHKASVVARYRGWAIAAGVALLALYSGRGAIDNALAPAGPRATVESASGLLHRLPEGALNAGAAINEGDVIRTEPGARAVLRLADGSRLEVNERTELFVEAAWSGQTVHLTRGDVIVQAAKQRRGHLRVQTRDSVASVKGTVFAVSTGLTGSLVSVVEGSVQVDQPSGQVLLTKGQRAASTPALSSVSPRQSVAWSQDSEKYFSLLGDFAAIEKQLSTLPAEPLRTASSLLAALPPGVAVYAAAPNLSTTLGQIQRLAELQASQSAAFNQWWSSQPAVHLRTAIDELNTVTPLLGDEMVFALARNGQDKIPVFLAQVKPGSAQALDQAISRLIAQKTPAPAYKVSESQVTISDTAAHLNWVLGSAGQGAGEPFAKELAAHYQRGAGWLIGLDLSALRVPAPAPVQAPTVQYAFFEQRSDASGQENEAVLKFDGPRTGIASWLAPAGATGAAEYITSEAAIVFSASFREPRQIFDELVAQMTKLKPTFGDDVKAAEAKLGINIADDLAAALGTDFVVAVERAAIPIPGWVAIVETYKPSTLDSTITRLVDAYNAELQPGQEARKLSLTQETVNGRLWFTLASTVPGLGFTWTHHAGFMVAAADRALAERAIATKEGGSPLVRSAAFRASMPASTGIHPSGFVWVNTRGALADVLNLLPYPGLKKLADNRDPILVVVNGETERIRAASRTRLTSLVFDALLSGAARAETQPKSARSVRKKIDASISH